MISSARSFSTFPTWRHSPAPPLFARAGAEWPASQPSSAASSPSEGPPLVGFILTDRSSIHVPCDCPNYRFISAKSRNPNLTSAAADGDFLFQHLPDIDYSSYNGDWEYYDDEWRLRGCDGGLLLLSRGSYALDLAVYDPLARTAIYFSTPPDMYSTNLVRYAIVVDEADASFRIIAIEGLMCMSASSAVFSSRTRKWDMIDSLALRNFPQCKTDGLPAGRVVYWRTNAKKSWYSSNKDKILVLDTQTMVWSVIKAPIPIGESYCIADMAEHGGLCILSSKEQCVQLWVHNNNDEWIIKEVQLMREFGFLKNLCCDD